MELKSQLKFKLSEIYKELAIIDLKDNLSLMSGWTGITLFKIYYEIYCLKNNHNDWFYKDIVWINSKGKFTDLSFANGYAGFIYVITLVEKIKNVEILAPKDKNQLLQIFKRQIIHELSNRNYELLFGAIGYGITNFSIDKDYLEDFIELLDSQKNQINEHMLTFVNKNHKGDLEYNLGTAHGINGLLSFLILLEKYKPNNTNRKLIIGLVNYLLSSKVNVTNNSTQFPYTYGNKRLTSLAWCYGDLSISLILIKASKVLGNDKLYKEAIDIATRLIINKKHFTILDSAICHGTAGIAHIYKLLYSETRLEIFYQESNYWLKQTIFMSNYEDGLAGFKSWRGDENSYTNEYGLLEGIAGIGMVMINSLHPEIEPTWDRCLLLS